MNYYVKRLAQALFTMFATITFTFALVRWMPGGPLDYILANMITGGSVGSGGATSSLSQGQLDQFRELAKLYINIDPTKPIWEQYLEYVGSLLQGDFGQSIWYGQPVWDILGPAIPWTVFIGAVGIYISFVSRVIIGGVLAYREGSLLDVSTTTVLVWGQGLPFYIVGLLLLYFFGYQLDWLPISGRLNQKTTPGLNYPFVAGVIEHAALPIIALAWATFGAGALAMRANAIQVLGEDYLRAARLRGIKRDRLMLRYVARNAILPMYTDLLIGVGYIFSGSIILETIFKYDGVGWLLIKAINSRDYPLMMGAFILITISVVIALMIADLTYGLVDPRVKQGAEEGN